MPKSAKITLLLLQPPIENTGQMMDEYFLPFHPNSIEKLSSNYLSKINFLTWANAFLRPRETQQQEGEVFCVSYLLSRLQNGDDDDASQSSTEVSDRWICIQ